MQLDVDFTHPCMKWRQQQIMDWDNMRKDRTEVRAAYITEWTEQIQHCIQKLYTTRRTTGDRQAPASLLGSPASAPQTMETQQYQPFLKEKNKRPEYSHKELHEKTPLEAVATPMQ